MKKFLFIYLLILCLLFGFLYWELSPLATKLNKWQIELSSLLTSLILEEQSMRANHILISPNLSLVIDKECNGFTPYFFFLASILAFPSSIQHKIKWAIVGYILLSLANVFRIWFIAKLVTYSESNFTLAHDYLGNIFLLLGSLLLFILFIKTR